MSLQPFLLFSSLSFLLLSVAVAQEEESHNHDDHVDSEVFEYVVGQDDDLSEHDHDHDHSGHSHEGHGHDHSAHSDHDHSDHDHSAHDHSGHDHAGGHDHEHGHSEHEHEHIEELNIFTGAGVNIGGFLFPEIFVIGAGGAFERGANAEDFATSEHDPLHEATFQAIEPELHIDINQKITGLLAGFIHWGEEEDWEGELEEAFLHYHVTDNLAIGGGRFLSRVGWQSEKHVHQWKFVNQNLVNSRMLNEGELIIEGGEGIVHIGNGDLTIGGGGVRTHAHGGEEEEEGGHADEANFNDWVLALDYKFHIGCDETTAISASYVTGENGFGEDTSIYGVGLEKLLCGGEDGFGCGSLLFRSEFLARDFTVAEDGEVADHNDYGTSTALHYGLSDSATLSMRYDWVSAIDDGDELKLHERHRISPALTFFPGESKRLQARIQYDYSDDNGLESEHAAWLQFRWQWGGGEGHDHDHAH
ncbi:MAG: hypothetical protein P1V20_14130 [Verrucomicrobiales bacterium]|nr:hypothetical protein [Verrucomicrobiales bacterium]